MEPLFDELLQQEQELGIPTAPTIQQANAKPVKPKAPKVPKPTIPSTPATKPAPAPKPVKVDPFLGVQGEELHKATWTDSPDWITAAVEKHAKSLKLVEYSKPGAQFNWDTGLLKMTEKKGVIGGNTRSTFAHEYGHFLDNTQKAGHIPYGSYSRLKSVHIEGDEVYKASSKRWKATSKADLDSKFQTKLGTMVDKDIAWDAALHQKLGLTGSPADMYAQAANTYGVSKAQYRLALESLADRDAYGFYRAMVPGGDMAQLVSLSAQSDAWSNLAMLSDIMEAATNSKLLGHPRWQKSNTMKDILSDMYGHGANYFKKAVYRPAAETFANMLSIHSQNNELMHKALEVLMPKTTAEFRTMMKGL